MKFLWVIVFLAFFIWSAIQPYDYFTWLLEVAPAAIAFVVLAVTHRSYPLTPLSYYLILAHCIVLIIGGHYTYAHVPWFDTLREMTNGSRNNYDKVGHFFQGFVPAIVFRELIIRQNIIPRKRWQPLFVVCACLAVSAVYELIEWGVALCSGESADEFLGTQGYAWDTQSDMGYALLGACIALALLSTTHNRQIQHLLPSKSRMC